MDLEDRAKNTNSNYYDLTTNIGKTNDGRIDLKVLDNSTQAIDDLSKETRGNQSKKIGVAAVGAIAAGIGAIIIVGATGGVALTAGIVVAALGGTSTIISGISFFASTDKDIENKRKKHIEDSVGHLAGISEHTLDMKSKESKDIETKYLETDKSKANNAKKNIELAGQVSAEMLSSTLNSTVANSMMNISSKADNISKDKINTFLNLRDSYSSKNINNIIG